MSRVLWNRIFCLIHFNDILSFLPFPHQRHLVKCQFMNFIKSFWQRHNVIGISARFLFFGEVRTQDSRVIQLLDQASSYKE